MNITEALNAALPDIPARMIALRYPRMAADIVAREHIEDGHPIVRVYVPSTECMFKFAPQNWALIQLFDGQRTYEEIAELYSRQSGSEFGPEQVQEFASELDAMDFWYKTAQEKNIVLMQKTAAERRKLLKQKSRYGDLSLILFPAFNPDRFLTWIYQYTRFFYTRWFTVLTLGAFACSAFITFTHWSEIGRDTLEFYNFSDKTWLDVVQFYLLAVVVLGVHEMGHGHACKHYGGRVPAMGFALIYLAPAFYTDTTEGDVKGTRYERLIIALAGVWIELVVYAIATPIWWGTPPDTPIHDAAYILMLITGLSAALINWNPLIKLDGYYMLTELISVAELKENSTTFVSAWVKHHIWGLPVEVPHVPKKRRLWFALYAILSGLYSYTVLYVVARFVGNVFRNFNPEWSFIPELATALLIFRSRLRTLWNFMKFVYLDKKDRILAWLKGRPAAALAIGLVLFLFLPLRRESVSGRFTLEPSQQAVIRAMVPGAVTNVYVQEGHWVDKDASILSLRNLALESRFAQVRSEHTTAGFRANSAGLQYASSLGTAQLERDQLARQEKEISEATQNLEVKAPISGLLITPRLADRVGSYVPEGTELAEIADLSTLRARLYLSEHDLSRFHLGSDARLSVDGVFGKRRVAVSRIEPVSSEMPAGLTDESRYTGLRHPNFYVVDLTVKNADGTLLPGMVGTARLYGRRRSPAGFAWEEILNFFGRKVW